jgi:formamidopyrimidine-DNA glycosylase
MPELPDVAYLKAYLDATSLHQTVEGVEFEDARILEGLSVPEFREALMGRALASSRRYGKYLFAELEPEGGWLVLHFGMSGWLKYSTSGGPPRYGRLFLRLASGSTLTYLSRRKLGMVGLVDKPERLIAQRRLGPDALELDLAGFRNLLRGRRGTVKSLLMDQRRIAGIGNIYSDEVLFQARIHPLAVADSLGAGEGRRLFSQLRRVLWMAAERKADPGRFPRTWLTLRRRPGARCPRSNGKIERLKISGRSAYLCPACQPER